MLLVEMYQLETLELCVVKIKSYVSTHHWCPLDEAHSVRNGHVYTHYFIYIIDFVTCYMHVSKTN